ncbi:PAS domain-containing protein [Streptomyces fungicidicus]|uniref:PAS domain-containing protein n=1 Tax=Streptomyces fungicidicus TaxID=68203 RepID=UPI003850A48E
MSSRPSRGAARLAAILDALPDALVLVNANGTVVNANTIALEAFETPGTALVGRGLLDLLPEFDSKLIPGSMRRPDHVDPARTKPTRMTARRTDGTEFPVEVTSANLENSQQTYDSYGYTGDELLMLVVRDLSGTVDTEAELARSQRQTEMILRAASEGVVGTDTDGRIVLVNPAAAQILGYRAGELGGRELHTLVLHSRADGAPFPYDESPLADTLRSGRKHRVRGQVLYAKNGDQVPVDLTTAPVRDGDQLVGAVMTFADRRTYDALVAEKEDAERKGAEELERLAEEHASELTALRQSHVTELEELRERHAEELAANEERYAALGEREKDRYEALAARHDQLLTLLGRSLRGPLDELRRELSALAADDAGQLWPEANQVLHHLSAGYARITTLIDNVLGYQQLDADGGQVARTKVMLDAVVAAGVDGAVELVGPGRVQFAVHAPPIEAEVEPRLLATALAHLVADVAGVDATGNTPVAAGGYLDNTVVVAAAQRGEVVRIEVRGPYGGGDPVHQPIVRGIVRAHGGVLQTHEVPGMSGSAYVLEVPIGGGAGAVAAPPASQDVAVPAEEAAPAEPATSGGRRRARRSSVDAFLESEMPGADDGGSDGTDTAPTGRRRRRAAEAAAAAEASVATAAEPVRAQLPAQASGGTGRRRGRPAEDATGAVGAEVELAGAAGVSEGAVVTAAEHAAGAAASNTGLGGTVPPQGVPAPSGRRARHGSGEQQALPAALPAPSGGDGAADGPQAGVAVHVPAQASGQQQPTGRRRRALAAATERAAAQEAAPRTVFALPPAEADQEQPAGQQAEAVGHAGADESRHDAVAHDQAEDHTPPQPHPTTAPTGRRRRAVARPAQPDGTNAQAPGAPAQWGTTPVPAPGAAVPPQGAAAVSPQGNPAPAQGAAAPAHGASVPAQGATSPAQGAPVPPHGTPAPAQGAAVAPQGAAVPAHGGPVPAQGAAVPPHGGPVPAQSTAAVPPHDGPAPAQGAAVPPQGAPVPTHGGPVPAQGAAATPHGAAAPAPGAAVPPHGGPVPPHGAAVPPHGGPVPPHGAAVPPHGGPVPPHGGPVSAQGAAVPPHGGPVPAQGAAVPPHGAAAPAPGASVPAQGAALPPHGGPVPPHGGPVPAQGAAVPPQGAPAPAHGGPDPAQGAAATPQGAAVAPQGASAPGQGAAPAPHEASVPSQGVPAHGAAVQGEGQPLPAAQPLPAEGTPAPQQWPAAGDTSGAGTAVPAGPTPASGTPLPPEGAPAQRAAQPLPAEASAPVDPNSTQGRAISVRTLGQGVPFNRQAAQVQQPLASATPPPHQPGGSGRRRKLGTRPDPAAGSEQNARPHPSGGEPTPAGTQAPAPAQSRLAPAGEAGRSYAIGAPSADAAEGPEPLDGPGGAVEVADPPRPQPMDDELPPEPLDNPRRLLVWPAPDVTTQQALSDRGYRPVIVHSPEEVDAQIAAFPAALFVDPLTGPITRTALQSLRQAAVAAEVPVLVTAGLGQASRDAAYGADPAVLLKALAPRDSEQHPPRVLLIEEHAEIALALTGTLERRGMQVARAASDADAVTLAGQFRPNLVVMDLMQVRRRQAGSAGIVDWLRANGQLTRTPLVVYTAAVDQADLPRLASGETVLFLAERSTSAEVQDRIVDLLSRIGTN